MTVRRKLHRSYFLSCYFWTNWPEVALLETLRMSAQPSSKDDVRRGLWMLPQQALFAKTPKGDFAKMSEPIQVYTACQFVKGQNMALIYFQLGNNSAMPPVANSSTSRNTLFPYLNLFPNQEQVKEQELYLSPIWREVIFIPDELSGSCMETSDQLGPKKYCIVAEK